MRDLIKSIAFSVLVVSVPVVIVLVNLGGSAAGQNDAVLVRLAAPWVAGFVIGIAFQAVQRLRGELRVPNDAEVKQQRGMNMRIAGILFWTVVPLSVASAAVLGRDGRLTIIMLGTGLLFALIPQLIWVNYVRFRRSR